MTQKVKPSTLADTSVTPSTYGGASQIPVFTVDQQGRLTYAANVSPSVANTQITGFITSGQIASLANTKIDGLITSGQIANVANTQIIGTTPSHTIIANGWTISTSNTKVSFVYGGNTVFSVYTNGDIVAKNDVTGFGTP